MDRPILRCFVAYPVNDELFTSPALVSLDLAAELKEKGWLVCGPDPDDEAALRAWHILQFGGWR